MVLHWIKKYTKQIALSFWLLIFSAALWKMISLRVPLSEYPSFITSYVQDFGIWAPIIYIALFAVRPLIFFPATLLSLSAGALFGPWRAVMILIIAENLSSLVSFYLGSYFGKDLIRIIDKKDIISKRFEHYFSENGFISVLTLRLVYAPFDLVGYAAGASPISYPAFALATFIGILPGLITSAFLSGSIYSPSNLLISGAFFVGGIVISRFVKKQYEAKKKNRD